LAALTEPDIQEVHVPTLADILEHDADKIKALEAEVAKTRANYDELARQVALSNKADFAELERKVAAVTEEAEHQKAALREGVATRLGLKQAEDQFDAAVNAYHDAIKFAEFEE
jgi:4-hydroxy-3-methylbut-2-en-1-yl diphosphate synthase IspG/GcpE